MDNIDEPVDGGLRRQPAVAVQRERNIQYHGLLAKVEYRNVILQRVFLSRTVLAVETRQKTVKRRIGTGGESVLSRLPYPSAAFCTQCIDSIRPGHKRKSSKTGSVEKVKKT